MKQARSLRGARSAPGMCTALVVVVCLLGANVATGQTIACTLEVRPGIVLEIRDAGTGAAAAHGAYAEATDGLYSSPLETVEWESDDPASAYLMEGAYERPAVYTVTVTRSGYRPWVATYVHVVGFSCHVRTVKLKAHLEKLE